MEHGGGPLHIVAESPILVQCLFKEPIFCDVLEMNQPLHWEKFFMLKPKIGIDVARFLDLLVVQIQILVYWNQISNLTFPQYELEELVLQSQFLDLKCNNFA